MDVAKPVPDDEIIAAGEAILAESRAVTGWGLRTHLGGGKPDRLMAVWRKHAGAVGHRVEPGFRVLSPSSVLLTRQDFVDAVEVAFKDALVRVDDALADDLAERDEAIAAAVAAATRDAAALVEHLEGRLAREDDEKLKLHRAVHVAETREQVARVEMEATGNMRAELREELRTSREALAAEKARADGLAAELAAVVASRDEARERGAAAEGRERAALERAARLEGELSAAGGGKRA